MKKLFLSCSAIFASIPGVAIMIKGLGTPPGYSLLFGGFIESLGVLSILLILTNSAQLKKLKIVKVNRIAVNLSITFFLSTLCYIAFFNYCVVSHPTHGSVYYPFFLNGRIHELVQIAGSRWNALDRYGNTTINKRINEMGNLSISLTTILLIFTYQTIFTSITIAFGLLGIRQKK